MLNERNENVPIIYAFTNRATCIDPNLILCVLFTVFSNASVFCFPPHVSHLWQGFTSSFVRENWTLKQGLTLVWIRPYSNLDFIIFPENQKKNWLIKLDKNVSSDIFQKKNWITLINFSGKLQSLSLNKTIFKPKSIPALKFKLEFRNIWQVKYIWNLILIFITFLVTKLKHHWLMNINFLSLRLKTSFVYPRDISLCALSTCLLLISLLSAKKN